MSSWQNPFVKRSQDWLYAPLAPAQTPGQAPRQVIPADAAYLRVSLNSMRIVNVRKGLSQFYGAVHSATSLLHSSGEAVEFSKVIVPEFLKNVAAANLDRVIVVNKPVAGWTPYRGGDLNLEIGLFSVKAVDMAEPFLSLLGDLGGLAAVPYVSAALPFMPLVKRGFEMLTDSADSSMLEVGISTTFAAPETGHYMVMRAPKNSIDVKSLKLDTNDWRLLDATGQPVADYPYLVFQIEAADKRDDWASIPEIKQAYSRLREDVRAQRYNDAKQSLASFKRTALTCYDLLFDHAQKLTDKVDKEVTTIMTTTTTSAGKGNDLGELETITW